MFTFCRAFVLLSVFALLQRDHLWSNLCSAFLVQYVTWWNHAVECEITTFSDIFVHQRCDITWRWEDKHQFCHHYSQTGFFACLKGFQFIWGSLVGWIQTKSKRIRVTFKDDIYLCLSNSMCQNSGLYLKFLGDIWTLQTDCALHPILCIQELSRHLNMFVLHGELCSRAPFSLPTWIIAGLIHAEDHFLSYSSV